MPLPNTNPTGYTGLKEQNPPEIWFRNRNPTATDYKLYDLLDLWQNETTKDVWMLISKEFNIAIWIQIIPVTIPWVEISFSTMMIANIGYIANGAALLTLTLPAIAPQGTEQEISGKGAGLWEMAANAGQTIHFGAATGTNVACMGQFDAIRVVCITTNTVWNVISHEGTFTIT